MPLRSISSIALLLAVTLASPLPAQEGRRAPSLDVGVGLGFGRGGGLRDARDGVAASAVLAWRLRASAGGAPLVGIGGSAQGPIDGGDACLLTPGGGCARNYPGFQSIGALGGWEAGRGRRGSAVRALAGPAVFRSEERATALGLQGRVDLATPSLVRVALVAWAQGAFVPRLRGDSYRMGSLGLGVRVR